MKIKALQILRDLSLSLALTVLATLIGSGFSYLGIHETNIVVVYIFSILLVARFTKGYVYGIVASVVSLLLFNWFFTEPYFTFKVNDMTYLITFAIMMLTSVLTSALTTKAKQAAEKAREREKESNTLYQMTNHLTDAEDSEAIAKIIVRAVGDTLGCSPAFVGFDENGMPEKTFIQQRDDNSFIRRELKDAESLKKRTALLHGERDVAQEDYLYPIYGKNDVLAVLLIPQDAGSAISESQTRMLHAIIEGAALALERLRSLREQAKSREETTKERYRGNLLRGVFSAIITFVVQLIALIIKY